MLITPDDYVFADDMPVIRRQMLLFASDAMLFSRRFRLPAKILAAAIDASRQFRYDTPRELKRFSALSREVCRFDEDYATSAPRHFHASRFRHAFATLFATPAARLRRQRRDFLSPLRCHIR